MAKDLEQIATIEAGIGRIASLEAKIEALAAIEARIKISMDKIEGHVEKHDKRLRFLERVIYGFIIAAAIFGWLMTQISNAKKLLNW